MRLRNAPCLCGSGLKYKSCCLSRESGARRTFRLMDSLDAVSAQAVRLAGELVEAPGGRRQFDEGLVLMRDMCQEGGPLRELRWPWEQLIPELERHAGATLGAWLDQNAWHARLFEQVAPRLLNLERLQFMDAVLRREMLAPGRTPEERRVLGMSVLTLLGAPASPPYLARLLPLPAMVLRLQVEEWLEYRRAVAAGKV